MVADPAAEIVQQRRREGPKRALQAFQGVFVAVESANQIAEGGAIAVEEEMGQGPAQRAGRLDLAGEHPAEPVGLPGVPAVPPGPWPDSLRG